MLSHEKFLHIKKLYSALYSFRFAIATAQQQWFADTTWEWQKKILNGTKTFSSFYSAAVPWESREEGRKKVLIYLGLWLLPPSIFPSGKLRHVRTPARPAKREETEKKSMTLSKANFPQHNVERNRKCCFCRYYSRKVRGARP